MPHDCFAPPPPFLPKIKTLSSASSYRLLLLELASALVLHTPLQSMPPEQITNNAKKNFVALKMLN